MGMRVVATGVALGLFFVATADVCLDASNAFGKVQVGRRCVLSAADGILRVSDIGQDMQLVFPDFSLVASGIDGFSYRYRARGTGASGGQLYYSWSGTPYADSRRWILPPLVADGEWHTVSLSVGDAVVNPASWRNGGVITSLRFDPTDSPGGEIEFSDIRFTGKGDVGSVRPPVPAPNLFDAPVWPSVTPECYECSHDPACQVRGPYFGGRFISAADDVDTRNMYDRRQRRFFLRRTITLKSKPTVAWLQGIGDSTATFFINGTSVLTAGYRHHRAIGSPNVPGVDFVAPFLKPGENRLTVEYASSEQVAGGVLAELYVEYADGTFERFETDREFESSADGQTNWKRVRVLPPPPTPPRIQRLFYRDFAAHQKCLGGGVANASVKAGETVRLSYSFEGRAPVGAFTATVTLRKGPSVWWTENLDLGEGNVVREGGNRWRLTAAFEAPLYFNDGEFLLEFDTGAVYCKTAPIPKSKLTISRQASLPGLEKAPNACVRKHGGQPAVFVNDKPFPLQWGGVQQWKRPDGLPRHSDMPLTAVTVYNEYGAWHPAVGVYDFASFDSQAELYRRANPDAYFIWDLTVYPPDDDWLRRHPEEMSADETGDIGSVGRFSWSFASRKSMDELREMVDRAIRYLEASPYANRIIGYRVNSGVTIEWLGWDAKPGHVKDFSEPNRRAYAAFAAERYPQLTDPHVPSGAERSALDGNGLLWDPQEHLNAIAYQDYNSWIVARDILDLCGQAKETLRSLGRTKLVGTYYGYTFYLNCGGKDQRRAHFNLRELLSHNGGRVDYLMSPQSYGQRNLGDTCGEMKPFATLQANGIVPVIEDDTRTHNTPWPFFDDYYQVRTERQSLGVLRRNMSFALCRLSPPYLYALVRGTDCDFPALAADGRALRKVQERCLQNGTGRKAQVALVASERSIVSMPELPQCVKTGEWRQWYAPDGTVNRASSEVPVLNGEIFNLAHTRFARAGAPVDYLLAEDLKSNPGDYRLYVFLNAFTADAELRAAVEGIRRRGATILWLYAPGWSDGQTASVANMKALTGIDFVQEDKPTVAGVTMKADGRFMGTPDAEISPMFHPARPDVTLGTYANGHPGLAAVKVGKSVSFFSGAWQLDVPFISLVERKSGVHLYCETGDPIEANDCLFALHARFPGVKTVRLPRKATVLDVFNRKIVARDADTFSFPAELHSSHLFYFGSDAEDLKRELEAQ